MEKQPQEEPISLSAQEQAELDAFAAELRRAHPEPVVSAAWQEQLRQRLWSQSQHGLTHWTLRLSMERSPWMRVAASLLLIAVVAAPVSAVLSLMASQEKEALTFGFDPAVPDMPDRHEASQDVAWEGHSTEGAIHGVSPPFGEDQAPAWSEAALLALGQSNRLALASQRWQSALQADSLESSLRARAFLLQNRAEPRAALDWAVATEQDLWDAFLLRCAQGSLEVPEAAVFARAKTLQQELAPGALVPAGIAAWCWIAEGKRLAGPEQGWPRAPFRP